MTPVPLSKMAMGILSTVDHSPIALGTLGMPIDLIERWNDGLTELMLNGFIQRTDDGDHWRITPEGKDRLYERETEKDNVEDQSMP